MCASAEQCCTRVTGRPSPRSREGIPEGLGREFVPTEETGGLGKEAEEMEEEDVDNEEEEGKRGRLIGGRWHRIASVEVTPAYLDDGMHLRPHICWETNSSVNNP